MLKFQNIKTFLLIDTCQIGLKIQIPVPWTHLINDLNGEEIIGTFYEKEL